MRRELGTLAVMAALVGACTGSSDIAVDDVTTDTTGDDENDSPPEPPADFEIASELVVPEVTSFSITTDDSDANCTKVAGNFFASTAAIDFRLNAPACRETGDMEALNGRLGDYVVFDDVFESAIVGEATSGSVDAGTYTAFEHLYVQCTNECVDEITPMVLLELATPVTIDGATYESIILQGDDRDSLDGVITVAQSLTVG